jgi:MFS family permease
MPVFAKEVLHGGSGIYGFMMGAAGFGALVGAAYLASRETILKLGRMIPLAATIFGAGLTLLAITSFVPATMLLMVIIGFGLMLNTAASNTVLQTITDDDMRGRVMSFYTMAIMGTAPFGSLIAGSMARLLDPQVAILVGGVSSIIAAMVFFRKLPHLKVLVKPVYDALESNPDVRHTSRVSSKPAEEASDIA